MVNYFPSRQLELLRYPLVYYTGMDPGMFDRRGPESRDDQVFNTGRIKLPCDQRWDGTPQPPAPQKRKYTVEYARIYYYS